MTQLKTLKNLGVDESGKGDNIVSHADLKKEAINWIKYVQECRDGQHTQDISTNFKMAYKAEKWIKHFFNITDEELK